MAPHRSLRVRPSSSGRNYFGARLGLAFVFLGALAGGSASLAYAEVRGASNAAQGLFASAESSSTIRLYWGDPNQSETGFRIERSLNGSIWSTVTTVDPDDTTYLDTDRSAATLYYYRLVTLIPADSDISNRGFATTFPASAAKVCVQRLPGNDATWAQYPSAAWNDLDDEWAVVWEAREDGVQNEIWFQRFHTTTLAPIGGPVNVSQSDVSSRLPTLAWNGSHYLVAWFESQRREPGLLPLGIGSFAVLEPDGTIVRRGVRPSSSSLQALLRDDAKTALSWDGTHWGLATMEVPTTHPFRDVFFRRLDESGEVVLGPTAITSTAGHWETNADLAFNEELSAHGVAWTRQLDDTAEPFFQRVEESTGALIGSPASLGTPFSGTYNLSAISNGADGWAVAWGEVTSDASDYAIYFRKVNAAGAALDAGKVRLSDTAPSSDFQPSLHKRSDGGFVVFSGGYGPAGEAYEIVRAEADSAGAKDGPVVVVSPDDGVQSYLPAVAEDGSRFLVVWNEIDTSLTAGHEIAGLLVDADEDAVPGPKVDLTTGHTPSGSFFLPGLGALGVQPLGTGFVGLWTDNTEPTAIHARSWDGSGATVHDFAPLNTAPRAGAVGTVAVGDTFAVFWRTATNSYRFARFDAAGGSTGESAIASAADGGFAFGFDGEQYAAFFRSASNLLLRRIDSAGSPVGGEITVSASAGQVPRALWTGAGWALLWRGPDSDPSLYFMLVAADGTVLTPATLVAARTAPYAVSGVSMAWNGTQLGVVWTERKSGLNPPAEDVYFTRLGLNGTKAFAETTVVGTPYNDAPSALYWDDGAFRLVHTPGGSTGFREIAIDPADGSVLPGETFWSNRTGGGAFAWNGVTLGMLWSQNALAALHFQTGACVGDPSPPPCPELSIAWFDNLVHLSWPAVDDPDSGIWRYQAIRDGLHLAELDPTTLEFDDAGFVPDTNHAYQLLAMNGAYQESDACATVLLGDVFADSFESGDRCAWSVSLPADACD